MRFPSADRLLTVPGTLRPETGGLLRAGVWYSAARWASVFLSFAVFARGFGGGGMLAVLRAFASVLVMSARVVFVVVVVVLAVVDVAVVVAATVPGGGS